MHSSVAESRSIVDLAAWKSPICICGDCVAEYFDRKHLLECLDSVVETVKSGSGDYDRLSADLYRICFCLHVCIDDECETFARVFVGERTFLSACRGDAFSEPFNDSC